MIKPNLTLGKAWNFLTFSGNFGCLMLDFYFRLSMRCWLCAQPSRAVLPQESVLLMGAPRMISSTF